MRRERMRWETEQTTQAGTRYGCFLPDLTGLARGLSAADLPPHYIRSRHARGKFRGRVAASRLQQHAVLGREGESNRGAFVQQTRRRAAYAQASGRPVDD